MLPIMLRFHVILALLAVTAGAQSYSNTSVVPDSGTHSAATLPFWQGYTYCQGRVVEPDTWQPLNDAFLVKLQIMHRHGARTPASGPVPGDNTSWYQCGNPDEFTFMNLGNVLSPDRSPYMKEEIVLNGAWNYTLWKGNCDLGELTSLGSHRMNEIGRILRSVYVDKANFLPYEMDSSFQISHTYIWRTRESVENLFAGLYPLHTRSTNQTLTMHVKPEGLETMLPNSPACPRLAYLNSAYANSSEYKQTLAPYAALQTKLVTAYNTTGLSDWNTTSSLFDPASGAYCHGLGLKHGLTGDDIQTAMIPATSSSHNIYRINPNATEVKRLSVGPWIQEILASFEDRSTLLQVFSAHDTSVDMFLAVVADPDLPWPAFSSSVQIELWQRRRSDGGGLVVRMFHEGFILPAHPDLKCTFDACPYEVLREFLAGFVVADVESACALS